MSEFQVIETTLRRMGFRRRLHRAWRGLWLSLLSGALFWLAALILYKLLPVSTSVLNWGGWIALACLPVGFLVGFWHNPTLQETARWVDARESFQERLSTALEISDQKHDPTWSQLVVSDAAECARRLDLGKTLPLTLPRISRWALLVLALAAGLGFVPEYRSKEALTRELEKAVMRDAGQHLAEFTRRNLESRPVLPEQEKKTLESMQELGLELTKAKLTRDEALKGLANAAEKLSEQLKEVGAQPAFRKLEQAARSPVSQSAAGQQDLQKQLESMEKNLGEKTDPQDALERLRRELDKLQQAASGMAQKDQTTAQAKRQEIAQSLSQLAQKAQQMGLDLPNLEEALKALESSDIDKFLKDLEHTEVNLDKLQALAKAMDQMQKKMGDLGKNLAEQLDKGQAQSAAQTLRKMADEMKKGNLSKEQMDKMLKEVKDALGPAKEYGRVEDLLKSACKKGESGDTPGASQELASAAEELEKMLNDMADSQSMMAALEALQKAQMCIGNCESWGQCKGPPKAGKGGKPGRGVGTWAEESGWMQEPQITERWDNSGVERPDRDPRGFTDRGDGQLADNLNQTRLKGRLNPGGNMPSMTLKGVSVKGTSRVAYQETVPGAQGSQQSALSQEHVPRAYQGAVRDYFDDSKDK